MVPCQTSETSKSATKSPRPRAVLAGALLFALAAAALPADGLVGAGLITGLLLISWLWIRPPVRAMLRWFLRGIGILTLLTAATPFFGPGTPIGRVFGLTVYREGLELWAAFLSRGALTVLSLGAAASSLGAGGMIIALARLPLPRLISGLFAVSWLQMHLLREEASRRARAVELRSFGVGRRRRRGALGGSLGAVFKRGLDRGQRLGLAMRLRGDGEPAFSAGSPFRAPDRLYLGLAVLPLGVTLWAYIN